MEHVIEGARYVLKKAKMRDGLKKKLKKDREVERWRLMR